MKSKDVSSKVDFYQAVIPFLIKDLPCIGKELEDLEELEELMKSCSSNCADFPRRGGLVLGTPGTGRAFRFSDISEGDNNISDN